MKRLIYAVKFNDIDANLFDYLMSFINTNKQKRILMQKSKQNADLLLVGEILAKVAIKKTFNINIAEQKFVYTEYGKPYLPDFPDVHFNISHSGEYVACVVSDKPVGIDIQKIEEYKSDIAKRVCNENELKQIECSLDKASEFIKLWTQKEAVLKMHGTGIVSGNIKNCLTGKAIQSVKIDNYWLSISC